jgi:hypothetical protein
MKENPMNVKRLSVALAMVCLAATNNVSLAQEHLTGVFRLSHTSSEILDPATAQAISDIIPVDEKLQWQVYVPENFNADRPPGIFVFIDPDGWGGMPDKWRLEFDNHNLIWVGASATSRKTSVLKQVWQAILAAQAIEGDYPVDLNRLYIGSTGGGALVAVNVLLSANNFKGAIYMGGSQHWGAIDAEKLENLRRKRHVFITGTNDKAKTLVRRDYELYKKDGIENAKLIFETGRLPSMPEPEHMDEALRYLDSR